MSNLASHTALTGCILVDKFPGGYPNLAAFADSHENFMMYRRFGYLSSRVLLERQDEMRALEERLDELDENDFGNNFERLYKRDEQGDERKKLLKDIADKFCEYGSSFRLLGFEHSDENSSSTLGCTAVDEFQQADHQRAA